MANTISIIGATEDNCNSIEYIAGAVKACAKSKTRCQAALELAAAGKDGFNTRADNTMKTAKMHKEVLCKADGEYGRFYRRVEDYASQMHCIDNSRFAAKVRKNRQECVVLQAHI